MKKNDKHSNKQKYEREVVEKFLKTPGIKIQANNIQSLEPPYPDVLCTLVGGKTIAFELTRTVDPKLARNCDFSANVKGEMRDHFDRMTSSAIEKLRKIFDNADLYFKFNNGMSKSKFMQLRPALFHTLLNCSSDMKGDIKKELLPAGVMQIRIERVARTGGPWFNASGLAALYFSDKTIERINEKFNKRYECDCPIELLVHSRIHSLPPNTLWLPGVQEFVVQQLDSSRFQRVWIFDYVESTIRYVYPEQQIDLGA